MSVKYKYAVIGGDARQSYLASILGKNHKVIVFGVTPVPEGIDVGKSFEETIQSAECILAPIPLTRDGETINCSPIIKETYYLSTLFQNMTVQQRLYAGDVPRERALLARRLQIHLTDYMNIEEIAWKNTVATAEGTLAEAIRYYPDNIQGAKCLLLGFGRCGMTIAKLFREVGADVTVFVRRREVMCKGECFGYKMKLFEDLKQLDSNVDIVINTIPSRILDEEFLTQLSRETIVLDIAGRGGGTDFEKAKELGIEAHLCSGLPGKYAPKASARILAEFVDMDKKQS